MRGTSKRTTGADETPEISREGRMGVRLGRLLVGALAAVSIQAATGLLPGIGLAAFADSSDGVPSIQSEPVHCDKYEINAYTPIITGFNATTAVDSQYIDYELQLMKWDGASWQPVETYDNIKPFISGYFVVTDGTDVVKDVMVPTPHTFLVPSAGKYRVSTTVWWTITGTPVSSTAYATASNWRGPVSRFGQHYVPDDVTYQRVDSCSYGDPLWVEQKGGPTIWPGKTECDGAQLRAFAPTIVANDATSAEDYQKVVYRLQLQQLSAADNTTWQDVGNASYVSPRLVVNDGTGTIKDFFLAGYHAFNIADPTMTATYRPLQGLTTATYRVSTTVWWTKASTSSTFDENSWSALSKAGQHWINAGLMYFINDVPQCAFQPPLSITITS